MATAAEPTWIEVLPTISLNQEDELALRSIFGVYLDEALVDEGGEFLFGERLVVGHGGGFTVP
ncbi:MAG: hypothetical protein ABI629_11500 [bacterium]